MVFWGYSVIGEYETFFGQLSRFLFESAQLEYQFAVLSTFLGLILLLGGIGSTLYGTVASDRAQKGDLFDLRTIEDRAQKEFDLYFHYCPLCSAESSVRLSCQPFGKDYAICSNCAAKWHIYLGISGLKWAKLENVNVDGKGKELLRQEYPPEFWQRTALQRMRKEGAPSVSKEALPSEPSHSIPSIESVYCVHCGTKNTSDAVFCKKCGKKLVK